MSVFRPDVDTNLGGPRRAFPSTCWSRFADRPDIKDPQGREAVEHLTRHYWKPVYAYIRAKWAKSNEDAKDLAQDFFMWMMESDFISKADPERGRFRAFLKVALEHYLTSEERKRRAQKRGGDKPAISIDGPTPPEPAGQTPDEALDRAWKAALFARAVEMLEEALRREGKELYFTLFNDYYLTDDAGTDYPKLAALHGISRTDLNNHLRAAKRKFRDILTNLVAETVRSEDDLQRELKALFGDEGP